MHMQIYEMEPHEFYVDDVQVDENGDYHYQLSHILEVEWCPLCGSFEIVKFGVKERKVRDINQFGKRVGIIIRNQRYKCNKCGSIFFTPTESIDTNAKITRRLKEYIKEQSLKRPFLNIADELGMTDTTVRRIFKSYIETLDASRALKAPRVLGIDENHLSGQYRAVFTDVEKRIVLDILPKRNKKDVKRFIHNLPEKSHIICVTIDMWNPYREAAYEELGNDITIVIDKFHVIKMVNVALETIRRRLRSQLPKGQNKYLRNNKYLLLSNSEDLSIERQQQLMDLFEKHPVFETPHKLKEAFRSIYLQSETRADAEKAFDEWKVAVDGYPEFEEIAATVDNWNVEIFNYFDMPFTNAATESLNNAINEISRKGKGYTFEVLRAKVLYGLNVKKPGKFKQA